MRLSVHHRATNVTGMPPFSVPGVMEGWVRKQVTVEVDYCRSAHRYRYSPSDRTDSLGFRVVRSSVK